MELAEAACPVDMSEEFLRGLLCPANATTESADSSCDVSNVRVNHDCPDGGDDDTAASNFSTRLLAETTPTVTTTNITIEGWVTVTLTCEGDCEDEKEVAEVLKTWIDTNMSMEDIVNRIQEIAEELNVTSFESVTVTSVSASEPTTEVQTTLPTETNIAMTSLQVEPGTNKIGITFQHAAGWSYTTARVFPADESSGTCNAEGYPDGAQEVGNDFISFVKGDAQRVPGSSPLLKEFVLTLDVNEARLTDPINTLWLPKEEGNDSEGWIQMCIQSDLWQRFSGDLDDVSVGFTVLDVKLKVDITNSTIIFEDIGAEANDVTEQQDDYDSSAFNVSAYLCEETSFSKPINEQLTVMQNKPYFVCLAPSQSSIVSKALTISSVKNQKQEELADILGVTANEPASGLVSKVGEQYVDGVLVQKWSFVAIALIFESDPNAEPELVMSGSVKLAFTAGGTDRRLEEKSALIGLRGLQGQPNDEEDLIAVLELDIPLVSDGEVIDEDAVHNVFLHGAQQIVEKEEKQQQQQEEQDKMSSANQGAKATIILSALITSFAVVLTEVL